MSPLLGHHHPPTDYLICSFMLSENSVAPSVGHCFGAECLTGRGKGALMGKGERNNFQLQAKKLRLRRTWGRGGIRSHGLQLCQFEERISEMH